MVVPRWAGPCALRWHKWGDYPSGYRPHMSEQSRMSETQLASGAGAAIAARADLPRRIGFFGASAVVVGVLAAGVPIYYIWRRFYARGNV